MSAVCLLGVCAQHSRRRVHTPHESGVEFVPHRLCGVQRPGRVQVQAEVDSEPSQGTLPGAVAVRFRRQRRHIYWRAAATHGWADGPGATGMAVRAFVA